MSFMLHATMGGNVLALQQARSNIPVPVDECILQSGTANNTLKRVNAALQQFTRALSIYDAKTRSGFLKRVVFRQGTATEIPPGIIADSSKVSPVRGSHAHFIVNFVTNGRGSRTQRDALKAIAESLCCGSDSSDQQVITGVTQSVHVDSNASAPPKQVECLRGHPFVYADVSGVHYRVSPNAFFQVNSAQVQQLFHQVVSAAKLRPSDVVLDLYCGTGAIALQLAMQCHLVLGVDMVPAAIEDAQVNAQLNVITNVEFSVADLAGSTAQDRRVLARLDAAAASVIVLDPGRSGISSAVRDFVMSHRHATRIVYVSCNSEKLSRDLRVFCAEGRWQCRMIQPVDMFPQTDHLEVVALLECSEP